MIRQVSWFIAVGTAAATTHWLMVVLLVGSMHLDPLLANVGGWLVAFCVSFGGHYLLTFRHQHKVLFVALGRFFAVSATGFLINEAAYALLLSATKLPYDFLLAIVLIAVAAGTFVVSRLWAFRHTPPPT